MQAPISHLREKRVSFPFSFYLTSPQRQGPYMGKIKVLSPAEAAKIAAGEVVERPSTVIKELVENSLDAGATEIIVSIEKAGKTSISIRDNGCGMSPEDAQLSFHRHATSKITSASDLSTVTTFGFRGEALASIAAVSHVTLETREAEALLGTRCTATEATLESIEPVACQVGTTITVRDLFYNTPARKKFLKQDETEYNHCHSVMVDVILQHPGVTISFIRDGERVLFAPATPTLKGRLAQTWGHSLASQMIKLEDASEYKERATKKQSLSLSGLISIPTVWRYNRSSILVFVNKRPVQNTELSRAVIAGYKNILPTGKFPAAVCMIEIDAGEIDVNIHPRKEEVKFSHPRLIAQAIEALVTRTLENYTSRILGDTRPQGPLSNELSFEQTNAHQPKSHPADIKITGAFKAPDFGDPFRHYLETPEVRSTEKNLSSREKKHTEQRAPHPVEASDTSLQALLSKTEQRSPVPSTPLFAPQLETHSSATQARVPLFGALEHEAPIRTHTPAPIILGQLHKTYILIQNESGLVIVDQHAAHERVLYHRYKDRYTEKSATQLVFPPLLTLSDSAVRRISAHRDTLARQGIIFEVAGPAQLTILSTPPFLHASNFLDLFRQLDACIAEHEHESREKIERILNEHVHSHTACKMAVRAGDILSPAEMEELIQNLLDTPERMICIHGRPTMWPITLSELEKKFQRRA